MPRSLTLRTDDETFSDLEELATRTKRSKNHLANEALKRYLGSDRDEVPVRVVTKLEDLAGDFWPEDDTDEFSSFFGSGA